MFLKPVDIDEVTDYLDVISNPMDITTMMNKIDKHMYQNVTSFVQDIDLICSNALEYNPDDRAEGNQLMNFAYKSPSLVLL